MSWELTRGDAPVVAAAIHAGHGVRPDLQPLLKAGARDRLREEDPHTDGWTGIAPNRIVVRTSRFEVDVNRPRDKAVYLRPEDAWGIEVWREPPPGPVLEASLSLYDRFYADVHRFLGELIHRFGRILVLDLHSFCYRRHGHGAECAGEDPDIILGTKWVDTGRWGRLVRRFMDHLRAFEFDGRRLDVRENIKFHGGHFSQWVNERFPEGAVAITVEVKKFFMDEWTGEVDRTQLEGVERLLGSAVPGLVEELNAR